MVNMNAYLPDIMEEVVTRIDAFFFADVTDPFHVYYDKGILPQVKRSVYESNTFPIVWFVMPFSESFGNSKTTSDASFQVIIAMPTVNTYTQQQRDDVSFKPRLLPIYYQLIKEMKAEKWFNVVGENGIVHTRNLLPYWGMGDVGGVDQPNLFKDKFIDAISLNISGLKVKRIMCV